ncbi:hypothetical protein [Klebsiella phage phiKp_21]|nr:hypothetical protein [Klebsiella phage phiKp_21]
MWKMKAAVSLKGEDDARWHVGYIAQQVRDALTSAGLDWTKYGLITYEKWDAVQPTFNELDQPNDDGIEAGEIYMLRMEECLIVEAAYQRREIEKLKLLLNSSTSNSTGNDESTN